MWDYLYESCVYKVRSFVLASELYAAYIRGWLKKSAGVSVGDLPVEPHWP